jgi:hypothetical protein
MFIVEEKIEEQTASYLNEIEAEFGVMPPHWKLFASLNLKRFKMFMEEIDYLVHHPRIEADFFAFLRLFVANKEGFGYCQRFNHRLLLARGYEKVALANFVQDITKIPLEMPYSLLAKGVYQALYTPELFSAKEIEKLKEVGWQESDIFDAIEHGAFLFKFSRILKAYLS